MTPPCIHVDGDNVLLSVAVILFIVAAGVFMVRGNYGMAASAFIAAVLYVAVLSRTILHEGST